jgi:hypothetical protein
LTSGDGGDVPERAVPIRTHRLDRSCAAREVDVDLSASKRIRRRFIKPPHRTTASERRSTVYRAVRVGRFAPQSIDGFRATIFDLRIDYPQEGGELTGVDAIGAPAAVIALATKLRSTPVPQTRSAFAFKFPVASPKPAATGG